MRFLGNIGALFQPYYLSNPRQIIRRIRRGINPARSGLKITSLPWGADIRVNVGESIGSSIWLRGVHDLEVVESLWRLVEPGAKVVDVGANIGYMTGLMAVRAGRSGSVVAFEPHPLLNAHLEFNVGLLGRLRGASVVEVHRVGISSVSGDGFLGAGPEWDGNQGVASITQGVTDARDVFTIRVTTLDKVLGMTEVAVMKVDTEGHEYHVLLGAQRLLENGLVRTIVYEDHGGASSSVHALLRGFGYEVFVIESYRNGVRLLQPSLAGHAEAGRYNYLATLYPEEVHAKFHAPGWHVFRGSAASLR